MIFKKLSCKLFDHKNKLVESNTTECKYNFDNYIPEPRPGIVFIECFDNLYSIDSITSNYFKCERCGKEYEQILSNRYSSEPIKIQRWYSMSVPGRVVPPPPSQLK